ncbi:GyrI-like domain-containing protein [Jeotgalibacillus sp. ET6]|uniref:GyrI-like domain-containing protein n=1 Tax=Jeotgalibacillus sp. ET6 TaxID=3037260 RepID=UPI0024189817|nr:GyrI-like domain-containing protein [Jeotgalibacillus sp. ET6]MDG5471874.1 GyrI-like domain-containing protein [Jeotgalibacillus sp. ET6]
MDKLRIVKEKEIKLIGFRVLCEGEKYPEKISKAAAELKKRANEIQNTIAGQQQIGAFVVNEQSIEEDGYWIGMRVSAFSKIPDGMITKEIPPQTYASILHRGSSQNIRKTYETAHQWIEARGLTRLTQNWHIEKYHAVQDGGQLEVELLNTIEDPGNIK